jgi:hypothetical protein
MKSSDTSPRSVARTVARAASLIHFEEKQSRRNRHDKRYAHDIYLRLLAARRERERVSGNKEEGPL